MTTLALVGGFLGAGKTTLLLAAAACLKAEGRRVAIILNDQGSELVDAEIARASGFLTGQVSAGCFCCRFSDFQAAAERLLAAAPDVIFAEAVGSCADLAATVLRPLRRMGRFRIAPLTVLVDPERTADGDFRYLFEKQIAEADIVLYGKCDVTGVAPPGARRVSALTGEGIADWLDEVLAGDGEAGARTLALDYARYTRAERALAWLDWCAELRTRRALTPAAVAGPLLVDLERRLTDAGARIAHLKAFVRSAGGHVKASICRNGAEPSVDGPLDAPPARAHELVLNARAAGAPEALTSALADAAARLPGRVRVLHEQAFRPAPPMPEHRIQEAL